MEYLLAKRVCSVSNSVNLAKAGRIYDIRQPAGSVWRERKEYMQAKKVMLDKSVTTRLEKEQNHGLCNRGRRRPESDTLCIALLLTPADSFHSTTVGSEIGASLLSPSSSSSSALDGLRRI